MVAARIDTSDLRLLKIRVAALQGRLDPELGQINQRVGRMVENRAEARKTGRFGAYRIAQITHSATQQGVRMSVWPAAAEVGSTLHPVFGRFLPQAGFKRRVWPLPDRTGYLVRPEAEDDRVADEYGDSIRKLADRTL